MIVNDILYNAIHLLKLNNIIQRKFVINFKFSENINIFTLDKLID